MAVAYSTASPQLAVAEFSPSARRTVEPPPTTGSGDNRGTSAAGARQPTTTPTTSAATTAIGDQSGAAAPTTRASRSRACYGDPPRQLEDPLAPTCVATIFEGDNGGATAKGVSGTEIRVAVPITTPQFGGSPQEAVKAQRETVTGFFEYFNNRFELYGRRLVPVFVEAPATDAVSSRAAAAEVAAVQPFAAILGPVEKTAYTPQAALLNELGRNEIVTMTTNVATWWSDKRQFDQLHPYAWSVAPSSEQIQGQLAAVACSLARKPAAYAATADLRAKPRRFAIMSAGVEQAPDTTVLRNELEACTGERPGLATWALKAPSGTADLRTQFLRLAADGTTTMICICEQWYWINGVSAGVDMAGQLGEWILPQSGYFGGDEYVVGAMRRGSLRAGVITVQAGPRLLPVQAQAWFGALLATRPALADGSTTANGGAYANAVYVVAEPTYRQLLMLASGIQAAGPNLTPDSFAAGLMSAQFPNPGAGAPPYWQPSVGFGPGDHGFYNDFTVGWWSDQITSVDPGNQLYAGSWCFVGQGARFTGATLPADLDARLFNRDLPCR